MIVSRARFGLDLSFKKLMCFIVVFTMIAQSTERCWNSRRKNADSRRCALD